MPSGGAVEAAPGYAAGIVSRITGFAPLTGPGVRRLILGSMPSRESLQRREYYGHPRNLFWGFMEALFGIDARLPYDQRARSLVGHGVAVWDVVRSCERHASSDAAIRAVDANDLPAFFAAHPRVRAVFFNGRKAADLFERLVRPRAGAAAAELHCELLPSTSPANASLSRAAKLAAWRAVAGQRSRRR